MNARKDFPLTIFHDGACPICRFDVANLQARNADGWLLFVDIAAPEFDPAPYGLTREDFAAEIRGRCADGRMVQGLDVFRLACPAVGLGWIVAPTGWAPLRRPIDALYRAFARNRHGIARRFGGCFERLAAWQAHRRAGACRRGQCGTGVGR